MESKDGITAMVEGARGALRRLGDAAPSRDAATAALVEIETVWHGRPFTIGVMGEDAFARTNLLNALCGGTVELSGRVPACAPVRLRRGEATRFRATRRDGTFEEAKLLARPAGPDEQRSHTEAVRAEVSRHELELLRAERAVPRLARQAPPWWAFWLWLIRWLVVRRARERLAAWQRAKVRLAESQRELAVAEEAIPTTVGELPAKSRERFFERLRTLCSGMLADRDVQEIELEVTAGPLAGEIEVIELTGDTLRARVDVTVRATPSHVELVSGESSMRKDLGSPSQAALGLSRLPVEARALWVTRRAREVLIEEIARLDDLVMTAEVDLRNRIARLENLRMPEPERFVAAQLERVGTQAAASIHAVLEHAAVHLGSELAQLAAQWDERIKAVTSLDELKALAAQIDEEGVTEYRRIAEETRMLVMGGVGGSAHDLLPELFSPLRQPGLPDEHAAPPRGVPALPPVAMLPSLTGASPSTFAGDLSGAGKWIAGLFRSIDGKRDELREKVRQRTERVRASADAERLDAEPALRAALLEAVGRELSAAVDRRTTWLANELAREQLAVEAERAELRPLAEVTDDARREARGLQEWIGWFEASPRGAAAPGVA